MNATLEISPQRQEHDLLLARLSSRTSTAHFAHAAVATFAGLIFAGTTGKLWWDFSEKYPEWILPVGVLALVLLGYATVRFVLGKRALAGELAGFERMSVLRRELGLDAAASLTP